MVTAAEAAENVLLKQGACPLYTAAMSPLVAGVHRMGAPEFRLIISREGKTYLGTEALVLIYLVRKLHIGSKILHIKVDRRF